MFESIAEQYLLIAFAVSVVLGIKYWTVKKSYTNKLQTYVPPITTPPSTIKQN
jgi:hypothetical protein